MKFLAVIYIIVVAQTILVSSCPHSDIWNFCDSNLQDKDNKAMILARTKLYFGRNFTLDPVVSLTILNDTQPTSNGSFSSKASKRNPINSSISNVFCPWEYVIKDSYADEIFQPYRMEATCTDDDKCNNKMLETNKSFNIEDKLSCQCTGLTIPLMTFEYEGCGKGENGEARKVEKWILKETKVNVGYVCNIKAEEQEFTTSD